MSIIRNVLIFISFSIGVLASAQEILPIQIYPPDVYKAETQNWSITQSDNDYIYVANNIGLLEFNGAEWKLYETPNQTILRSVKAVGDKIYTGCYMEFGYWERNSFNQLTYTSLSKDLPSPMIEDEQVWNIIALDKFIIFQSLDRLYSYDTNSKEFKIISSETTLTKMVEVNNTIYYQKLDQGIFKIENGKETLFSDDDILKSNRIINIFNIDGQFIIQTNQKGFFVYDNDQLSKWNIPANDIISNLTVYSSVRLEDGSFAIGTISNGIINLNKEGNISYALNQNNGLSNNTVLSVFEDKNDNIWLGLDNGINCINSSSPFRVYDDKKGQLGAVHAAKVYDDKLYLGTNQGLFVKPLNSLEEFKLVDGTKGQVWCLEVYDNTLFCGHDLGTFVINETGIQEISDIDGTWRIKQVPNNEDLLLKGSYAGLSVLQKVNNEWQFRNKIDGFDISSKFFELLDSSQVFVSHEYKGVFKLDINDDYTKVLKVKKESSVKKGLHSSLIKYNSDVLYAYSQGIYSYDVSSNSFQKDTILSKVYNTETYVSGKLVNTPNKLWSFSKRNVNYISPGLLSDTPQINRIPLSSELRESLTGYENIIPIDNQEYLIGTSSGYIIVDLSKMRNQSYRIEINSISNYALDSESKMIEPTTKSEFHNKNNNFGFTYSIAEFDKFLESEYQYRLDGNYNKWSSWSSSPSELFKNLPFGDYTFYVRGRVGNQMTDNVAEYSFTIDKPWYLSNFMVFLYVLSIMTFSIIMHNVYKRNYKKQKEKLIIEAERELELKELENEQQLMSLRNEQLKQDIDNKNRELAISTMSLIKKNEFLNNIKEELKSVNETEGLNPVIKIIDKNLNNTDDWKFFEEAFNNADKDFLKKVKAKHPSLTPNDLKLCAYLRLNLSSKEIAPLLNISSRSVEVKRYRLRKKMELPHESSLTNYILEI
ncbi:helix-turn-helix and ligand-binding sensor domain-containing protein [Psychroserpens luteolus]|uniref:helix-turn-helix and ligand-binding sensor domain-containing protein n=1 Tax=Psychroserpens luteolus TaxID=2855840 RepID=UPI001E5BB330|nr:triple tyrosine motif-containing protein [Psychroserpens luteolus]MCD2259439.1 LuxR C-terminal-related transcriptional regulator [Psychroserpens luteolus]